jgi:hypothetical protein
MLQQLCPHYPGSEKANGRVPEQAGTGGRLSTVHLLMKVACFAKKVNNVCNNRIS